MTFTEAALEVLLSAGEPLHYKKITELAIAGNLLSHVGKTPEVTMSSRLATLVKKDRGQSPIIKIRPGVFALRESAPHMDKDPSTPIVSTEAPSESAEAKPEAAPVERPKLPGADVFPEEADDDFPILAGLEEDAAGAEDRSRRRRRRRRRGAKSEPIGPEASAAAAPAPERRNGGRPEREPMRHDRDAGRRDNGPRNDRDGRRDGMPRNDRDAGRRDDRDVGRRDDRDASRRDDRDVGRRDDRDASRRDAGAQNQAQLDFERQPNEGDLLGKDLADAAYHVLSRGDRMPASFARVAEMLVRRGRLSGGPDALAPTVAAALRADAARTERAHGRPRFRLAGQRVSLTEWLLPRDAVRSEENAEQAASGQRDQIRRAFMARLNDLPAAGFAEMVASWLNAEGVTSLRAVRRPGSSGREFHFAGTLRRGAEEMRLAFIVLRSGRDIDRDSVVEARGSLHHYGSATGAWVVSTGRINQAARDEAGAEGAAPCALFGGSDLARAMEALGIGVRLHYVALCDIDFDLLESLGDNVQSVQPRRDEPRRERDDYGRDRRPDRPRDRDRDRPPRGEDDAAAASGTEPSTETDAEAREDEAAALTHRSERESAPSFDLLDPEAAEASRLVPAETQAWDAAGEGGEDEEGTEEEGEFERRPTVRMASPIRVGDDDDEAEADDASSDADDDASSDADADGGDDEESEDSSSKN